MTAPVPTFLVVQAPDLVAVAGVLALTLLLLAVLAEQPAGSGAGGVRPALPEQPEDDGGWPPNWLVKQDRPTPSRSTWLVSPGEVVIGEVPAEVQAEALQILDTLRTLDALFPDHEDDTSIDTS